MVEDIQHTIDEYLSVAILAQDKVHPKLFSLPNPRKGSLGTSWVDLGFTVPSDMDITEAQRVELDTIGKVFLWAQASDVFPTAVYEAFGLDSETHPRIVASISDTDCGEAAFAIRVGDFGRALSLG